MLVTSFINNESVKNPESIFFKTNPFRSEKTSEKASEKLHEVHNVSLISVIQAIQGANKAYEEWRLSSIDDRIKIIQATINVLENHKLEFAQLEALDQGLPLDFVLKYSVEASIELAKDRILELENYVKRTGIGTNLIAQPVGPILIITSWNLSLRLVLERALAAIAAGNSALIKVSSTSPITAEVLKRIVVEAQLPSGLIQILISDNAEVKKMLIAHPGIKAISFVGALKTALEIIKEVATQSNNTFKKIQIACGSKNIAASLEAPEQINFDSLWQSFLVGQGQLGWNSARLFVLEKYEKEWTSFIAEKLNQLTPSEGIHDKSLWGPCLKEVSYQNFNELMSLAKTDHAKLISADHSLLKNRTNYLSPTFTKDMSKCSTLQQDQVHAPLFILSTAKYPFDITKNANISYYGFAAHLYGEVDKFKKIADQLEVGSINYNSWSVERLNSFSAVKQSGWGQQDYRIFGGFYSNTKIVAN